MQRRRTTTSIHTAAATVATTVAAASTLFVGAGLASAVPAPAPNTSAVVTSTTVFVDGEDNGCAIKKALPKVGEHTLLVVDSTCGSPVRPLMGGMKYVKNKGKSYEQVTAEKNGQPVPEYTKEQTLISYGIKQPVYLKDNRDAGIVGYLVLQIPKVGSILELHAQYQK